MSKNLETKSVLVTGANGFIGRAIAKSIETAGMTVRRAVRRNYHEPTAWHSPDLDEFADWSEGLSGIDCVIHCSARVHQMQEQTSDALAEFRKVNTSGTLTLAKQAAAAGVSRFIFLSSCKVNGEETVKGSPFREAVPRPPQDPYGLSKYEAETGLLDISASTGMEVVIIRLPLVYGPDVKANFALLIKIISLGIPLPFASIDNRRSLLALDNLCHFILHVINHPAAAGEVFLIADEPAVSTSTLIKMIARAKGKPALLFPFPIPLLKVLATITGKRKAVARLVGSLELDTGKTQVLLGWHPPFKTDEALKKIFNNG
ncbi:UDP-glucose 4-epimerase [Enterobacter roggenkampii]|uniref:UDP-glucose 4-epimerase family protein n=1 Tax=Enterobacter cloacae complex TaxID=354276 RepID=UPI0014328CD7|nr:MULTISPECIES: SDR family oxidoreductase [Enterobacter cloacae complex]NKD22842.1 SDR family oxidoreductase [Enterobacter asburiae]BDS22407.1 UDP-glucose 4-epimerase [Enterobacter roggenkampii]